MAVHFPDHQLKIIDYNRVVKDLNGLTEAQLLEKLNAHFEVKEMGTEIYHPAKLHEFSMYLGGKWYRLTAKAGSYDYNDPIGVLKKRVDSGEMKVAFALYPVSMEQLLNIADTGNIMPPKTTWFEPKLRSGLVIHKI